MRHIVTLALLLTSTAALADTAQTITQKCAVECTVQWKSLNDDGETVIVRQMTEVRVAKGTLWVTIKQQRGGRFHDEGVVMVAVKTTTLEAHARLTDLAPPTVRPIPLGPRASALTPSGAQLLELPCRTGTCWSEHRLTEIRSRLHDIPTGVEAKGDPQYTSGDKDNNHANVYVDSPPHAAELTALLASVIQGGR